MKYLRILLLSAGLTLVAGSSYFLVRNHMRAAEARAWPVAQGRIVESQVRTLHAQEAGNTGDFMPHVRYDYAVHGQRFRGDTLWLDERRSFGSANVAARELVFLETGTETEVLYNPQDPHEAALMIDKPTWRWFFLALLGMLFVRLGWPKRRPKATAPGQELVRTQATAGGQ